MEETFNIEAIVLKRRDFREDDSRVSVYSPEKGKMDLVVRGGKKMKSKLSGHVEPLTLSRFMVIRGREFNYVGSVQGENFYAGLKNDLENIPWAVRALEAVDAFSREGEEGEKTEIFELLRGFLGTMESPSAPARLLFSLFLFKILDLSGFRPNLERCEVCEAEFGQNKLFFDENHGSLVCEKCAASRRNPLSSSSVLPVLSVALKNNLASLAEIRLEAEAEKQISELVGFFWRWHNPRREPLSLAKNDEIV